MKDNIMIEQAIELFEKLLLDKRVKKNIGSIGYPDKDGHYNIYTYYGELIFIVKDEKIFSFQIKERQGKPNDQNPEIVIYNYYDWYQSIPIERSLYDSMFAKVRKAEQIDLIGATYYQVGYESLLQILK